MLDVYRLALEMAENGCHVNPESDSIHQYSPNEESNGADGPGSASDSCGLSASQKEVLERCLHALTHAKNDSHILAALLLVNCCSSSSFSISYHQALCCTAGNNANLHLL